MKKSRRKNVSWSALLLSLVLPLAGHTQMNGAGSISLNGRWQMGFGRRYDTTVIVPSIATDPTKMSDDVLWYKKEIKLPSGRWKKAILILKGARFQPQVYVNGKAIGKQEGGMAPLYFELNDQGVAPGKTVAIEIALASLKMVQPTDASFIPYADHWRSNVGSSLWDDVVLHVCGETRISRVIPFVDEAKQIASVHYELTQADNFKGRTTMQILDEKNNVIITKTDAISGAKNRIDFSFADKLNFWTTDAPNLYRLHLVLYDGKNNLMDETTTCFAVKSVTIRDKQFYLNEKRFVAKGPTVVWPRWMRTKEGRELGYDTTWFIKNIIQRTKDLGGNYLRFHLGLPPERFLDLCDRFGLAVQFEWSFFHGMPASKESLLEQYRNWLDVAMRHPSVSFIHPYNETGGEQLKTAWAALDELLKDYPPLLVEDRDVIHVHKYWWSLFENLGLYYDSAGVFPKAIMADEFGGDYLDEDGNPGLYSTVKETFLRFLGRTHSAEQRLAFQAEANAKVAEYWRRIGAAGYSPFCALASKEDGNTWFLGPLREGRPKPVWNALAAAFSPQSVSAEIWDKNFTAGQQINLPVYVFNDEEAKASLLVKVTIENKAGKVVSEKSFTSLVNAFSKNIETIPIKMPSESGDYILKAELINRPKAVKQRVISSWNFQVYKAVVPAAIQSLKIGITDDEKELKEFLQQHQFKVVDINDPAANILLTSLSTWSRIARGDTNLSGTLQVAIATGKSVVMLDAGDKKLGQGYPEKGADLGPLQGVATVRNPVVNKYTLFGGISLKFTETAEPESHLHPDKDNNDLWKNISNQYTRLWNGLRGGLIVPAADMEFSGLNAKAFLTQWKGRGADESRIIAGSYYGYDLQGFYEFSEKKDDKNIQKKLRDKVIFLVNDAPALANSINPSSPITTTDLSAGYREAQKGIAENLIPLAACGKNLTQTPVAMIDFGKGKGRLIVSQLLTAGRLAKGFGQQGLYGIRYDEVAVQFVLNMMVEVIKK